MLETPFPYQNIGARWIAPMPQALLADDMGLGKSCQAIRGADTVGADNILVICPAAVRVNWEREFEKFSPMGRPCSVIFTGSDPIPAHGVVIISYDLAVVLAHKLKAKTWDLLILDECHFLKERTAKRTKAIYGHGKRFPGIDQSAKRVWRLSGTPAPNNASELWTHLKSAGMTTESYWDFTFRYCSGFDNDYGYKITGHKNTNELKAILAPFMLRRTKEEVMAELPPIRYQEITVERSEVCLDPDFYEQIQGQRLTVAQFNEELKLKDSTLRTALAMVSKTNGTKGMDSPNEFRLGVLESMAASLVTLRRYIALAKLPAIMSIIKDELETGAIDKIVLFGVHQTTIEGARRALAKFGAVTLYGLTPAAKRQANIDRFMKDPKCRVFIGNIAAAGVGITLTSACEVAFLEQSWVPSDNAQAAMRCHRIGQDRPVRVRIFSLNKSVDEQVQATLMRKARELTKIF